MWLYIRLQMTYPHTRYEMTAGMLRSSTTWLFLVATLRGDAMPLGGKWVYFRRGRLLVHLSGAYSIEVGE